MTSACHHFGIAPMYIVKDFEVMKPLWGYGDWGKGIGHGFWAWGMRFGDGRVIEEGWRGLVVAGRLVVDIRHDLLYDSDMVWV